MITNSCIGMVVSLNTTSGCTMLPSGCSVNRDWDCFFVGHGNCRPFATKSIVSVEWVSGATLVVSIAIPICQVALLLL